MDVKNHNTNRKKRVVRKRWNAAVLIALFVGILLTVFQYLGFVSKTVYEESVSHLTEIFHQSDNMLSELTNKNLTYLHIWGEYLQNTSDESEIREYIEKAQEDAGFLDFYFLSADGNYKMVTGETGYLGLQENIEDEIRQGNDVITNATVPGKSQLLVFATPRPHGSYQGFEYDAIAIAYENSDIVNVLNISAFNGNAQSYVVHPDGRVVIDHSLESWGNVYNFFGILREHTDISEKEILEISKKFKEGHTGAMLLNLDEKDYYLVYEKSGIQDWVFLGLVQADIVNASMNTLQLSTMLLVGAVVLCITAVLIGFILRKNSVRLKKKDTEILYRDEMFQKLSMNVDDVFLMLDAKTYRADYVSPNVEKLLGITVEQIRKDISVLGELHSEDTKDPKKDHLKEIQVHEQQEWDFEYVHQKTGERRWFHSVAMGSEVNGNKKYILVMSDRTADKKMNQALSDAVHAAENANQAKSTFLSNMSHDIRTPLTSLDGYFQLMEACENVEEQRRYLNIIHERIHSLNEMLEELFMFTKLKNESYRLELTSCCINRILKETVFSYYDDWVRREIQPDIQITEEQLYIDGNKQGLSRIIQNVIKNGLDHGEKKIRIVLKREQNRAVLRISNQVIASEKIDIEHVFDRFYKADAARSKTSTGLGLSIAREFVRRMNGEIGAKIEENEFIVEMSFNL